MRPGSRDPAWILTLLAGGAALLVSTVMIATRFLVPSELAVIRTEAWPWTSDGVIVQPVGVDSPFRSGDLVVAMDGRPMARWVDDLLVPPWIADRPHLGASVTIEVRRAGQPLRIDAARVPFPLERVRGAPIPLVVFGVGVLLLALTLVVRRPRATALRLLFVGAAANAADIVAWQLDLQPSDLALQSPFLFAFGAAALCSLLFWSCLVHLLLIYPVRSPLVARHRTIIPLIYAGPVMAFLAGLVIARLAGGSSLDWIDRLASVIAGIVSIMLAFLIAETVAGYRRTPEPRRRQVRFIAASLIVATATELVLITLPIVLQGQPLVPRSTVALVALPVLVALALAVIRDRLFQVNLLTTSRERIVAAREEERRRLRRDLHDGLGPTLAALGLKLDLARQGVRSDPTATEATLDQMRTELRAVTADLRRIARDLRPPALDTLGLVGALREQGDGLMGSAAGGPAIMVLAPEPLPVLPAATEVAAYRIAVEGMMNVVRHADATRCEVRLAVDEDGLLIEVVDDGRGISDGATGVGTRSIHERAAEVGGEVTIEATPGGGTRLVATLPLERNLTAGPAPRD